MLELLVSNGMLASGVECWTQAYLRTLGLAGSAGIDPKMKAGGDAHLALEQWMQGQTPEQCLKVFNDNYRPFSEIYVPTVGRLARLRHENLTRILDVYLSLNGLNVVDFDVVATEKQLKVELYRDDQVVIYFTDKSDGIVKMHPEAGGGLASMEHKTGEYIDDDWFSKYDMDGQVTGHVFASRASGWAVDGVVINAIQFARLPDLNDPSKLKKKGGYKSCPEHKLPFDSCYLSHVKFMRKLFTRTDADIEQWHKQAVTTALDYYQALIAGKMRLEGVHLVPQQGLLRGACRYCDFKPFCQSHRLNYNLLTQRPKRDDSVLSSGLYQNDQLVNIGDLQ